MRNCNDQLSGGSCKAANSLENGSYTLKINSNDAGLSACDTAADGCSMDTCQIDLHFMGQIRNFLVSPAGQSWSSNEVISDDVCIGVTPQNENRICTGTAPNKVAVIAPPVTEAPRHCDSDKVGSCGCIDYKTYYNYDFKISKSSKNFKKHYFC